MKPVQLLWTLKNDRNSVNQLKASCEKVEPHVIQKKKKSRKSWDVKYACKIICAFLKDERYLMPFYYKDEDTVMPFKRLNIMLDNCLNALTPKVYASTVNKLIKLIVDVLSSDFFFLFIW